MNDLQKISFWCFKNLESKALNLNTKSTFCQNKMYSFLNVLKKELLRSYHILVNGIKNFNFHFSGKYIIILDLSSLLLVPIMYLYAFLELQFIKKKN